MRSSIWQSIRLICAEIEALVRVKYQLPGAEAAEAEAKKAAEAEAKTKGTAPIAGEEKEGPVAEPVEDNEV